jgi:hypothetical protein
MKMLNDFHFTWRNRFLKGVVDDEIAQRCLNNSDRIKWIEAPLFLHKDAMKKSLNLISPMISGEKPVLALSHHDVTEAGVDFHCSNVLETIIQDPSVYTILITETSKLENVTKESAVDGMVTKERLLSILKGMMWKFSAGVNVRQSLSGLQKQQLKLSPEYQIWSKMIQPHVKSYVNSYISCRLSKHLIRR